MKTFQVLLIAIMALSMNLSCSAQSDKQNEATSVADADKVEVYYFHYTRRCVTCKSVEDVTKNALAELYGDNVTFANYNLDEPAGEAKGKEIGVSGQTLLIVNGDTKINITNEGFMNARNPDNLKAIIKDKVDPLLN